MNRSRQVFAGKTDKTRSRLIKSMAEGLEYLESYDKRPSGVFGSEAKIICGDVVVNSNDLDLEFNVKFDDDMEANEAEVVIYNLTDNTINQFKYHARISIIAGFKGDTGLVFSGYITKVKTKQEDADKVTTITCIDDVANHTISEITYAAGTKASYILRDLLKKTGIPIAVFNMRRDWTYKDEEKVDGDLMENIKKFSEVCGVSTYINKGQIYSRYIKTGDNLSFNLSEETGLIGSPSEFTEEKTAEDYKETINGYECECILQHRFSAGGIINLSSLYANGQYRICSGEHTFNADEAISRIKIY